MRHYGTSRHTVRAALAELQELGLVSRRKNVGTRVEASAPTKAFRPSLASVEDLVQFGAAHLRVVQAIEEVTVSGAQAKELGCASGAHWLRISSLRRDGDANTPPIGWTDVYIDPTYAEIGEIVRASPGILISSLIEARYGRCIAEIRQDVCAFNAGDTDISHALGLTPGQAALKIVRRYFDASGHVFEVSVTVHPADRFSLSMRLQRSNG
ncbi:GntR family transcriptional regulator [Cupriavidus sp. 2MCAB6]|uniref:GntR family transcriptional regulator n=1 Tax=Cupriavidus sp. 2MCAB6 TaxID=3232981 RepID=UPI003F8EAB7E